MNIFFPDLSERVKCVTIHYKLPSHLTHGLPKEVPLKLKTLHTYQSWSTLRHFPSLICHESFKIEKDVSRPLFCDDHDEVMSRTIKIRHRPLHCRYSSSIFAKPLFGPCLHMSPKKFNLISSIFSSNSIPIVFYNYSALISTLIVQSKWKKRLD